MGNTCKTYSIVIEACNKDGVLDLKSDTLSHNLSLACQHFYGILHDKDTDENGELKRPHYHFVCVFDRPIGKKKVLNLMSYLNDIDIIRVSARETLCFIKELRYLRHLDNPDKYQYQDSEIITDDFQRYVTTINNSVIYSESTLYHMILDAPNKMAFMLTIGMDFYNRNYHYINDLRNAVRNK